MKKQTKISNLKMIIGIFIALLLFFIGASILRDLLILILDESKNKILFRLIHLVLIYIMINLLLKTKPLKIMEIELTKKFQRKRKNERTK
jgi:hypothetical protein